jgi:hypothetical protein
MVRDRGEFDSWVTKGSVERLRRHPLASRFLRRQLVRMPAYADLSVADRDALWSYARWLSDTRGGLIATD